MVLKIILFFGLLVIALSCKPKPKTCADCNEVSGKELFANSCASCHGMDGKLGNSGAADLTISNMTDDSIILLLNEGKGAMPPALDVLEDPKKMNAVIDFAKSLRSK